MRRLLVSFAKTGAGTGATLLFGIVANKILAVIAGPSAIGLFSLLKQTHQTATTIGTLGGQTALVQGIASRSAEDQERYLVTVLWLFLLASAVISVVLIIAAPWIASILFSDGSAHYTNMLRLLPIPIVLGVLSAYLQGVMNAFRTIGRLAVTQASYATAVALLAYPTAKWLQLGYPQALIGLMTLAYLVSVTLAVLIAYKGGWLRTIVRGIASGIDAASRDHFLRFSATTLVTATTTTAVLLVVRSLVARHGGLADAGVFDAAWTVSMTYVSLLLASFGTYYLPSLAGETDRVARDQLIHRVMRLTLLLMVPLVTLAITLKPLVIRLLYTEDFLPAVAILRWMFMADYLKVTSWCLGIILLAFADLKVYFWKELVLQAWFLGSTYVALFYFAELQGIGVGFLLMYGFNLGFLLYYVHRRYGVSFSRRNRLLWLGGAAIVAGQSWSTWTFHQVDWAHAVFWLLTATAFVWLQLTRSERASVLRTCLALGHRGR